MLSLLFVSFTKSEYVEFRTNWPRDWTRDIYTRLTNVFYLLDYCPLVWSLEAEESMIVDEMLSTVIDIGRSMLECSYFSWSAVARMNKMKSLIGENESE